MVSRGKIAQVRFCHMQLQLILLLHTLLQIAVGRIPLVFSDFAFAEDNLST